MAQFASPDATISILTDDDDADDSSENEIYSRTEPETAERPMIGRQSRSRDSGDGQSDEPDDLRATKNSISNGKHVGVSSTGIESMEGGSNGCLGTPLSPTVIVVLSLLVASFPVHFPAVLLPHSRQSADVALRVTICSAIVGAIVASMTSQLAFKMAAINFRWLTVGGCVGVMVFAVIRCFVAAVPVGVLGCSSLVAGFLLTWVRVAAASHYCRSVSSQVAGVGIESHRSAEATTYRASSLLSLAWSGLGPFISSSLYLTFLANYTVSDTDTDLSVTSSVASLSVGNSTSGLTTLSSWFSDVNTHASTTAGTLTTSFAESTFSSGGGRLVALLIIYALSPLGALLLVIRTFDDDRHRKEKSSWSVSSVVSLVLDPLNAFRRQDVALLSPLAILVGAQQMFAYFAFVQEFVPLSAGTRVPVMAGLCMAGITLLVSTPVGYLLRHTGRVKLLLPVAIVMTSLLLCLLLLDETRSRDTASYLVIGCAWSVCDSCLQVCFIAVICQLPDDDEDESRNSQVVLQSAVTICYSVGQLLIFLLYSYTRPATAASIICVLILLPVALLAFLAAEIYLRLAEEEGETLWCRGRGRQRYVLVRMDDEKSTWLPQYDPLQAPRQDRTRPLFGDRDTNTRSPHYVARPIY